MVVALERRLANYRLELARREGASSQGDGEHPSEHPESGVSEGAQTATPTWGARKSSAGAERLAVEVGGELVRTAAGSFVALEGRGAVVPVDRERLASLPGQPPPHVPLVCLDTETTGLATASGTLAFLVGLGWWEGSRFRQLQLLLPDHADEPALLHELRSRIPTDAWLVTYNGRGFDWPLLTARYRMVRSDAPPHAGHLDLLPLVRRLFRHRMPDARLQTAERELLGMQRHRDVAGWEIPARYLQFLRDGEPAQLIDIVRHNDEDVRSLAHLVAHLETRLGDPVVRADAPSGDLAGLARAFSGQRRYADALACVEAAIDRREPAPVEDPPWRTWDGAIRRVDVARDETEPWWSPRRRPDYGGRATRERGATWPTSGGDRVDAAWTPARLTAERARLLRRLGRHVDAEAAWLEVADLAGTLGPLAWIEIAKIREHHRRDPEAALAATLAALRLVERRRFVGRADPRLERELGKRAARLRRRIARRQPARTTA